MKIQKAFLFLNQDGGNLKHKIIRSGIWVTFANTTVRILQFVRSIILARLLTPEIFGIWGIVNFVRQGIEVFTQTGFGAELIHRQERVKEAADVAWTLNVVRGFVLTIVCFIVASYVAQFYNKPVLGILLRVVGISFLIKGFSNINLLMFQKNLDFKKVAIFQQTTAFIGLLVTLTLVFLLRNVWALVWGTLAYFVADLVFSYVIQRIRPRLRIKKDLLREIFRYGIFITGSGIVVFVTTELDNALVGKVLGMQALGFYVLAYQLANMPATEITQVVSQVMFPAYSKLQMDTERLSKLYLKVLKIVSTVSIPAAAGLFVLAPEIISVVYGHRWDPCVPALQVLCVFGAIRSLGATTGPLYNAVGLPKIPFYLISAKLIVILILLYPLSVRYGIVGTAWAVTLPSIVIQFFSWRILSKILRVSVPVILRPVAISIIGSGLMAIGVATLKNANILVSQDLVKLALNIFIGISIYAAFIVLFQRSLLREIIKMKERKI